MPLCIEILDESEEQIAVGPGEPPFGRCLPPCCTRTARLQIRVRYGAGNAALCAEFYDPDSELTYTEKTVEETRKAWQSGTPPTLIRTCVVTTDYVSGDEAVKTWTDPEYTLDCGGEDPAEGESPPDCLATLNDPPAEYTTLETVTTYGGDTGDEDDVKTAAIGALEFDEWSDWEDIVEIDLYTGSAEGAGLSLLLASSSVSTTVIFPSHFAAGTFRFESQLRVLGPSGLHLAVSEGEGEMTTLPITRYTLEPGAVLDFSSAVPSFAPEWLSTDKWLRCVCPPQLAPEVE